MTRKLLAALLLLLGTASTAHAEYQKIDSAHTEASIRVKTFTGKESDLCPSHRPNHAGWADLENGHHLFYWFHEARHDSAAPLLVWLQGGPGASSMFGFLFEHGPCLVKSSSASQFNPYSWTETYNIIYMDSPADAGFSYHDDSSSPLTNTTALTANDIVDAIGLLYEAFPHLAELPLHISGESYGGHWVPGVGAAVLARNEVQQELGAPQYPLRSLVIGNGWTDPLTQTASLFDVGCHEFRGYDSYLNESQCAEMLPHVESCNAALRECGDGNWEQSQCEGPVSTCQDNIVSVILGNYGSSPYDRRKQGCQCDCYQPRYDQIRDYLAQSEILDKYLELSNATNGRKTSWVSSDPGAPARFVETGDMFISVLPELERALAEPGVDVLVYAGVADVSCNPRGLLQAVERAKWDGQVELIRSNWQDLPWQTVNHGVAGRRKMVDGLWFVEVNDAGHYVSTLFIQPALLRYFINTMQVPLDQPVVALELVKEWREYTESPETWNVIPGVVNKEQKDLTEEL